MNRLALSGEHLTRTFDVKEGKRHVVALDNVSIRVASGSLTALVGPDGAGKTTLLRLAAGLLKPDQGTLTVLGIDVVRDPQAVQDRISYMPQRFGLYEDLSVQENLDLYADLHGISQDARATRYERLMKMTDLGRFTDRPAGQLSGGMKQKLGLACALVRSPELLLLDEPTVGVDPLSRRELWDIVEQLVATEKLTVVVSTAYLDEAERCSEVFLLNHGGVLASGSPAAIRVNAENQCFIATPPAGQPARWLQARLLDDTTRIVDAVLQGGEVRFIRRPDVEHPDAIESLAGAPIRAVSARLEDGFMVLLHRSQPFEAPAVPLPQSPARSEARMVEETAIEVKDLVRRFGSFVAVAHTSFSVRRGEVFGLLGPNGAGKTTTFRMLCGLLPPTSGSLRVAGVDLRHSQASARRRVGYVSQKFALYGNLTVNENLEFFAGAYGLRGSHAARRIGEVVRQFALGELQTTPSNQLFGGHRQRLAMAAALLHQPDILFLDEPTSGADPLARREFWRRMTALAQEGTTIVVTTHFMEEAEYCDRIIIQDAGAVLAIGTPAEVRHQAAAGGGTAGDAMSMEDAFIGIVQQSRATETARNGVAAAGGNGPQEQGSTEPGRQVAMSLPRQGTPGREPVLDADRRGGFWRRLRALTRKEVRQLLRDPSNLASGIALPAILILLFGYGISLDVTNAPIAVDIEDASPTALEVLSGLQLSPYLAPVFVRSMHEAQLLMSAHGVDAILRVPSDFSAQLSAGNGILQLILHGSDPTTARIIQGYISGAIAQSSMRNADRNVGANADRDPAGGVSEIPLPFGSVVIEQRLWFNAANTSSWYLVPGLIVLVMTLVGAFLTSLVVAREWERGTLEALFVTPVRPVEILLAKLVPYFVVGMIGFTMCVLASRYLFRVPMEGSLFVLVMTACLYMLAALGLGLLISSAIKNQFLASQAALLVSFMPAVLLSGFLFDLRNVPAIVRFIGEALPATHFLVLIKTLLLSGNVWPLILRESAMLAAFAIVLLGAATRVTQKRIV